MIYEDGDLQMSIIAKDKIIQLSVSQLCIIVLGVQDVFQIYTINQNHLRFWVR